MEKICCVVWTEAASAVSGLVPALMMLLSYSCVGVHIFC